MGELLGLRRADVGIIGGELTGMLLGASLAHAGLKVAIVDADDDSVPKHLEAAVPDAQSLFRVQAADGMDIAAQYASALQVQLNALLAHARAYVRPTSVYTYARTPAELPLLERQHALYTQLGLPVSYAPDAGGCPYPVEQSLLSQGALIDLSRWRSALTESIRRMGGQIYTGSRITLLDGPRACSSRGCLHAPVIILTTGIPLGLQDPHIRSLLERRIIVHCSLTGEGPLHNVQQSVTGHLLLTPTPGGIIASKDLGRTGTSALKAAYVQYQHTLRSLLPDWQQRDPCFTHDVFSADGLPVIGALPGSRFLCAAGISGILGAMHAAEVLTRHILGKALPEDAMFGPSRYIPAAVVRQAERRTAFLRLINLPRWHAPVCAHCGTRMRYFGPARLWGCPVCSSTYDMLGLPTGAPALTLAEISPLQRPSDL